MVFFHSHRRRFFKGFPWTNHQAKTKVIGRLGQTILVLFSWKAFSLHIMASMNRQIPVTYDTFWTFFMAHEVSFGTIWACIRDFASGRSLRCKTTRLFIVLTMMFVMAWPTLASAMTGYNSNNTAFFKTKDGTFVAFSALQPVLYVVHDGSRVGLGDDYVVPYCAKFREFVKGFLGFRAHLGSICT